MNTNPHPDLSPPCARKREGGLALIEALVAILLVSFGIIGIIGLQANAITFTTDANHRVEAGALADRLVAEMWVNPTNLASYAWDGASAPPAVLAAWVGDVENILPGAATSRPTVVIAAGNAVTITVRWQMPGGGVHNHLVIAQINQNPEN